MKQFPPNPKPETLAKRVLAAAEDLEPDDMIAVPPVAERYASAEPRRAYETSLPEQWRWRECGAS